MAKLLKKEHLPQGGTYDVTVSGTHSLFVTSQIGAQSHLVLAHNCHRMSKDAQDVLLKPLEERKMIGMFCTTEPEKVRGAIRSRCEEYNIRKVTRDDILVRMKHILEAEKVEYEDDGVLTVIDFAGGHVRDVVSRLEMIAQIGPVTLDNVRDHLNLSVVSTYYQVLINLLSDPKKALQLVDQACERVTAEEVASGLSEAAMNSFRLANGLGVNFSFTDKELAKKVYELHGLKLIEISSYFLRSRYVTQVGLICDLTTLAFSGARVPTVAHQPITLAPTMQVASAPAVARAQVTEPPVAHSKLVEASTQIDEVKSEKVVTRGNPVVGNLGSDDPQAMTIYDTHVIPEGNPGKKTVLNLAPHEISTSNEREPITREAWRRGFAELWSRGGNG